jgi:hypothetical protein
MRQHFLKAFLAICLLITFLTAIPLSVQAAAYGNTRTERTSITFLDLVRTRLAGQLSVLVRQVVLPFESQASSSHYS